MVQNVLDEAGSVEVRENEPTIPESGEFTIMRVPLTEPLQVAWEKREKWMHPRHPEIVYESVHRGLYYHGFLIYAAPTWLLKDTIEHL